MASYNDMRNTEKQKVQQIRVEGEDRLTEYDGITILLVGNTGWMSKQINQTCLNMKENRTGPSKQEIQSETNKRACKVMSIS